MRIAINSGPVVVGDVGSRTRVDYTVLGNTVNVCARLEAYVGEAGEITIGGETHRMLGGTIPTADVDALRAAGAWAVFPVGTPLPAIVSAFESLAAGTAGR